MTQQPLIHFTILIVLNKIEFQDRRLLYSITAIIIDFTDMWIFGFRKLLHPSSGNYLITWTEWCSIYNRNTISACFEKVIWNLSVTEDAMDNGDCKEGSTLLG